MVERPSILKNPPVEDNEADFVLQLSIDESLMLILVTMFESPVITPKPPLVTA